MTPKIPHQPIVQFVVGGVQKSGTTALHNMLSDHPEISMPNRKELHYFDDDQFFRNTEPDYSHYHNAFESLDTENLFGESTPSYIYIEKATERIKQYNSEMKWIILLRQPVERAYSQWNMQRNRNIEPLEFTEALKVEPSRLIRYPAEQKRKFAYASRGFYANQIERLLLHFDRSQCLFLKHEEMLIEPKYSLEKIYRFLQVSIVKTNWLTSHKGVYEHNLDSKISRELTKQFKQDVKRTAELTNLDLSDWIKE